MVTFILEKGQNKNSLSKTSFDHNDLEKLFFVSTVQLKQHQEIVLPEYDQWMFILGLFISLLKIWRCYETDKK